MSAQTDTKEWTLWMQHNSSYAKVGGTKWCRVAQGSLTECRRESRYRTSLNGYRLSLIPRGINPDDLKPWPS